MPAFQLIKPLDQPLGKRRLLNELRSSLEDDRFSRFCCVSAFCQRGPLLRLESALRARRAAGWHMSAILGVDKRGTSYEALELALALFDDVFVSQGVEVTFHPKFYAFHGEKHGRAFIGSNNLTVGGTETNFEVTARLDFELPKEGAEFAEVTNAIEELLPDKCAATARLTEARLVTLRDSGVVPTEIELWATAETAGAMVGGNGSQKGKLSIQPPSPLPKKGAVSALQNNTPPEHGNDGEVFAIQIRPHHNGEIFLSVTAALQNPDFFGWPFQGLTTPKRAGNAGYPQRLPDPRVRITVWGASAEPLLVIADFALNTVYYAEKSEIRITASQLVPIVPEYSVMVMGRSSVVGLDYIIDVHRPDSADFEGWLDACNQSMPGGGRPPRKFGWF